MTEQEMWDYEAIPTKDVDVKLPPADRFRHICCGEEPEDSFGDCD